MTASSLADARARDAADALRGFRADFHFPSADAVYLVGNSLGLEPKRTRDVVNQELDAWARLGVEGHFAREGPVEPWVSYHELFTQRGADLVGALPGEVVAMGSLTANLHSLMVSFYRPTRERHKIVVEQRPFPSDRYALASHARTRGFDDALLELEPRAGEETLRTEDILRVIDERAHEIALLLMGGVSFYTGQLFDIRTITRAAKAKGIAVGWDLAHAAGNVPLALHDDDVDFAAWCTYKYLNSGPGSVAMAFVHERHARAFDLPRYAGWWSNDPATRFEMARELRLQPGAAGWQVSNAPVLSMAALHASLDLFARATMPALRKKSVALTGYLLALVDDLGVPVITPRDPDARGAQLSLRIPNADAVAKRLLARGVYVDERKPDVIRVAPAPLYNSHEDAWRFAEVLRATLGAP